MMKLKMYSIILVLAVGFTLGCSQQQEKDKNAKDTQSGNKEKVENVILFIGDGMGVSQIYAGMTVSKKPLIFEEFRHIGFQKTYSASDYTTDSGASGTALATGKKTKNGRIGVGPDGKELTSILKIAEDKGLATGLISTSAIVHATPAAFIANNKDRHEYNDLAHDFLKTDIDVFIGGGRQFFENRDDGMNLVDSLKNNGYQVAYKMDEIKNVKKGKLAGLTAKKHNPKYTEGRGDMLPVSTATAIDILDKNAKGFFLMVEGSQIDWGGHANDADYIVNELLDFNNAVKRGMEYAKNHKNTLVIVTADHECGGMALNNGSIENHKIEAKFTTDGHTGVMVPVFAFGPGAEEFMGIYENTDIFKKLHQLYGFGKK
jgi:alkaline phosphatase